MNYATIIIETTIAVMAVFYIAYFAKQIKGEEVFWRMLLAKNTSNIKIR